MQTCRECIFPVVYNLLTSIIVHSEMPDFTLILLTRSTVSSSHFSNISVYKNNVLNFCIFLNKNCQSNFLMSLSNSFEGSFSDVKDPMDWRTFTPSPEERWILWQMPKEYFKVYCVKQNKKNIMISRVQSVHRNYFTCVVNISTSGA